MSHFVFCVEARAALDDRSDRHVIAVLGALYRDDGKKERHVVQRCRPAVKLTGNYAQGPWLNNDILDDFAPLSRSWPGFIHTLCPVAAFPHLSALDVTCLVGFGLPASMELLSSSLRGGAETHQPELPGLQVDLIDLANLVLPHEEIRTLEQLLFLLGIESEYRWDPLASLPTAWNPVDRLGAMDTAYRELLRRVSQSLSLERIRRVYADPDEVFNSYWSGKLWPLYPAYPQIRLPCSIKEVKAYPWDPDIGSGHGHRTVTFNATGLLPDAIDSIDIRGKIVCQSVNEWLATVQQIKEWGESSRVVLIKSTGHFEIKEGSIYLSNPQMDPLAQQVEAFL